MPFSIPRYVASWLDGTPLRNPPVPTGISMLTSNSWPHPPLTEPLECLSTVAPLPDAAGFSSSSVVPDRLLKETGAQVAAGFITGMLAAPRYAKMANELIDKKLPLTLAFIKQKGLSNALTSIIVPIYDELLENFRKQHIPFAGVAAALSAAAAETLITFNAERRAFYCLTGKGLPLLTLATGLTARAAPSWYISGESRAYAQNQQLEAMPASAVGAGAGLMTALATTPLQNFLFARAYQSNTQKTLQFFSQKPSRSFSGMHHRAITFAYFIIGMMAADAVISG